MNKLTNDLKQILDDLSTPQNTPTGQGRRKRRNRKRRNNRNKQGAQNVRARASNNPLTRNGIRGPVGQSLTSSQFTATSPLNLFKVTPGSSPGGIRVKGRELIGGVTKSNATQNFQLCNVLGPISGLSTLLNPRAFPRLTSYAPIYEYFIYHSATIILQSNRPTTSAGAWMVCIDHDINDLPPTNTSQMMRNVVSTMANVYSDMSCVDLKSLSRLPRYTTAQTGSSADELTQAVQGQIFVACEGFDGVVDAGIGYMIIEYDIEFFVPQ